LYIFNLEFGLAVNSDDTGIVLLTTLLGVKVGLVEQDTERSIGRKLGRRRNEFRRLVKSLDGCLDILDACSSAPVNSKIMGTYQT
jgi:hypothetical protein